MAASSEARLRLKAVPIGMLTAFFTKLEKILKLIWKTERLGTARAVLSRRSHAADLSTPDVNTPQHQSLTRKQTHRPGEQDGRRGDRPTPTQPPALTGKKRARRKGSLLASGAAALDVHIRGMRSGPRLSLHNVQSHPESDQTLAAARRKHQGYTAPYRCRQHLPR